MILRTHPLRWVVLAPAILTSLIFGSAAGAADIDLRERTEVGRATEVAIALKAEGTRPDFQAGAGGKPLPFQVETRLEFRERVLGVSKAGLPTRVVRRAGRATVTIGTFRAEGQKMQVGLRPELSLLIAERRSAGVMTFSAGGPLLRSELDLVQGPGDPLMLPDLLPVGPVEVGASWDVPPDVAKSLSEYEALAANGLKATLASADDAEARISLKGELRGTIRGGEGTMTLDGTLVFDCKASLIKSLSIKRVESRKAGLVESAIEATSTLTVERSPIDVPAELADTALAGLPTDAEPARELLELLPPGGKYRLLHDRDWHLALDDASQVVLKRIQGGELIAQCNLMRGPNVGRGRHQDLQQFRDEIRKSLGKYFASYLAEGEVGDAPAGGLRYKVSVEGQPQEGGRPLWHYYLIASPEGDQLVAVFSLTRELEERFGDQDLRLIGSLEWTETPRP